MKTKTIIIIIAITIFVELLCGVGLIIIDLSPDFTYSGAVFLSLFLTMLIGALVFSGVLVIALKEPKEKTKKKIRRKNKKWLLKTCDEYCELFATRRNSYEEVQCTGGTDEELRVLRELAKDVSSFVNAMQFLESFVPRCGNDIKTISLQE